MHEEMKKLSDYFGSKSEAARLLGIHPQTWFKWEQNGGPAHGPAKILVSLAANNPALLTCHPRHDIIMVERT